MKSGSGLFKTIRGRLTVSYGLLMLIFISLFIGINISVVVQLKEQGIDQWLELSTENVFNNIDLLIRKSVRQHLKLESEKLVFQAQLYYELAESGIISEENARERFIDTVEESSIGESGYSYIVNSQGVMLAHPVEEYRGVDFSWDPGITGQLDRGSGYIDYQWKNPEDESRRDKTLYMSRFEPWDMLISTTAYSDDPSISDIEVSDVRDFIEKYKFADEGHTALISGAGDFIIPPRTGSRKESESASELLPYLEQIKNNGRGKLKIPASEAGVKAFNNEIVYYYYLPYKDWIVATCGLERDLYSLIITIAIISILSVIVFTVLFLFFNRYMVRILTSPLYKLINILDESAEGNLSKRCDIKTGDEFEALGNHFNSFMAAQQDLIGELQKAEKAVRLLAKFPDENPNPVLRINDDFLLEYANKAAHLQILSKLNIKVGDKVPDEIMEKLTYLDPLARRNEYEISGRTYSFSSSRIKEPPGTYFYGRDITKQKRYESLMLLSENIFNNSIEGIVITDKEGNIESVNPAFTKITGYTEEEAAGKNPRILKSQRHNNDFYKDMWERLLEKGYWDGEIWNRRKNGNVYPEYLTITSLRDKNDQVIQYISFFHDLSSEKEKEDKIKYEATHDQLTRLPNREYLNEALAMQIKKAELHNSGFSLLYIDVDNLKRVNDSLGTEAGDILLKECARRLNELFKQPDLVVRMGSDEFAVLMPERSDNISILTVIEDVLRIFKPVFVIKGRELDIYLSIGISVFPDDDYQPQELVAKAETAMRSSKTDVNNIYQFYTPVLHKSGINRVDLESGLKQAFENQQFYLNYQPKVDVQTGLITGSEALVRMNPIDGEFVGPDVFISVAEEIGLIEPLGAWVLERACRDTLYLQEKGFPELNVAVNLSPWQFRNADLVNQVDNIIQSTGISPRYLNLELTEGMAINNIEESIQMMKKLTSLGLSLSLDDFGTGYSSLSYLSDFSVDFLKIDKSFVDGIPDDTKKTGIALAVLAMAQNLGMQTVAEGVETKEHYEFMKERGCTYIQGYYFYKPMLIGDYEKALRENHGLK